MDALQRFEDLIESTIEGSLAEATTAHLQPVEIAKKLARTLDRPQAIGLSGPLAPNVYRVMLNSRDYDALSPIRCTLESELASYLRAAAAERGLSFVAPPSVSLEPLPGLRPRRMRIEARMAEDASVAPTATGEFTAPLPVAQVRTALQRTAHLAAGDGRVIVLAGAVNSIGRQLDNDIVLEDRRVSRHHAQLRYEHGTHCLYDLASANGSFVNGERVERALLRDGDFISLGGLELVFHLGSHCTAHLSAHLGAHLGAREARRGA